MQLSKNIKHTYPAFIASLFIHTTLVAAGIYISNKETLKPVAENKISIKLSNYAPVSNTPKAMVAPKIQESVKPKKAVIKKEIPKKATPKKVVAKKDIPKEIPIEKPTPQEAAPEQEEIVETVLPLEAFTPPVSSEVVDLDSIEKTLYSPKTQDFVQLDTPQQPSKQTQDGVDDATLSLIRSMIQDSLVYPALAKRLKIEGVVVVSFILTRDGRVEDATIVEKSKSTSLDTKALQTVTSLSGKYPHLEKQIQLQIPVAFSLKRS